MSVTSTVYDPVESWRVGRSLGVDLLCDTSLNDTRMRRDLLPADAV